MCKLFGFLFWVAYVGQTSVSKKRVLRTTAEYTDILLQIVSFKLFHTVSQRLPNAKDAFLMWAFMSASFRDDEDITQPRYLNVLVFLSSPLFTQISAGRSAWLSCYIISVIRLTYDEAEAVAGGTDTIFRACRSFMEWVTRAVLSANRSSYTSTNWCRVLACSRLTLNSFPLDHMLRNTPYWKSKKAESRNNDRKMSQYHPSLSSSLLSHPSSLPLLSFTTNTNNQNHHHHYYCITTFGNHCYQYSLALASSSLP